jgi:5-methylcytosine-specific restriction endonuclease McrA
MPFKQLKKLLFGPPPRLTREEALKVFKRDHFKCQYCGLDGLHHFENWLILTVDHVQPHAKGGARSMDNLATACQPCNLIKGKRVFKSRHEAKDFVLAKREEWRHIFHEQIATAGAAKAAH